MRTPIARFRLVAVATTVLLVSAGALPAQANTKAQVGLQQRRLTWLEGLVKTRQERLASMQDSMRGLASEIEHTQSQYHLVDLQLHAHQREFASTSARYRQLRRQIRTTVTNAYINGPAVEANLILSADSVSLAQDVVEFTGFLVRRNSAFARQARIVASKIKVKTIEEQTLLDQRSALLGKLRTQQNTLTRSFSLTQQQLAGIAKVQTQVRSLLAQLRQKLQSEELRAAEATLGGTPLSFGRWAQAFLTTISAPVTRNNMISLVAWETAEYTNARWNPLATTYSMPGAGSFNGSGVKNYASLAEGLQATFRTLQAPGHSYGAILRALAASATPMTTARAINASDWCHGCANGQYVIDLIPAVTQYYDHYAQSAASR